MQVVNVVVSSLTALLRGPDGFMCEWLFHHEQSEPGSRWRLNSFAAISRLVVPQEMLAQRQQEKQNEQMATASDEDIAAELEAERNKSVEANPELAIEALRKRGYTVIEPSNSGE